MRFEPVVGHKLADVFDGVELGRFRRQRQERDVAWYGQLRRNMPSRLIEEKDGMCAWGDCNRDFLEMQSHGLAVAGGQDKPSAFPFGGTDGAENIGRRRPLVVRRRRTRPTLGPAARDLVLLADARPNQTSMPAPPAGRRPGSLSARQALRPARLLRPAWTAFVYKKGRPWDGGRSGRCGRSRCGRSGSGRSGDGERLPEM